MLALAVVGWVLVLSGTTADAADVRRHVLALHDGRREPTPTDTLIHMRAEMPLNHLGYIVEFRDVSDPLPDPATLTRHVAVLTWFTGDVPDPAAFFTWLSRVADRGLRIVMIGSPGGPATPANLSLLNRALGRIGIAHTPDHVLSPSGVRPVVQDRELVGFEREPDREIDSFPVVRRLGDRAAVGLEIEGGDPRRRSVLVATGPGGGFAHASVATHFDPVLDRMQWVIDPFTFFRRALGDAVFPIPDATTVAGRRLWFSHVDGDGWNNLALMQRHRGRPTLAAEVMLRELIEPYPDLPVTIGLVAGDIDTELGGGERAAELARRIFALPQVEVGSHTCTHPFRWSYFERYDRAAEERLIAEVRGTARSRAPTEMIARAVALALGEEGAGSARSRWVAGSHALPRAFLRDPFGVGIEVGEALRRTAALAPPGKPVAIYQWSGDARPFAGVVRATRQAGVRNINGGDTRFDAAHPSVAYVSPLSRVVGTERQIYAAASNENTYTNGWTQNFGGFSRLSETVARTGAPRRLKGVNVYYHVYSAEHEAALAAVRGHLEWARHAAVTPITTSHYAAIADGFFSTRIVEAGPRRWRIDMRDGLSTVRFDDADRLAPDLAASEGVLGFNRHGGSLYVALDPAVPEATLALSDATVAPPAVPVLVESRWPLSGLRRAPCAVRVTAQGFGPGEMVWAGWRPGTYEVVASAQGRVVWRSVVPVGADGRLDAKIESPAFAPLEITIGCVSVEGEERP